MRTVSVAALLALVCAPAMSEQTPAGRTLRDALDLSGSVRAGYFSASRRLDEARDVTTGSVWLRAAPKLGDSVSVVAEGWVRNDSSFRDGNRSKLREGYLDFSAGRTDVRIGKQIIAWGRADELNPTDNLTPRDFTLLVPETGDQRFGTLAARAVHHVGDTSVTAVWLPDFSPNIFPIAATPGVQITRRAPHRHQAAVKLERSGDVVDWSVSYFDGLDLYPDLRIAGLGPAGLALALDHNRIRVVGGDVAAVVGRFGLRAEAAYTWTAHVESTNPLIKKPFLYAVFGADRTFAQSLNVNVQYFVRRVTGFQDPYREAEPLVRTVALQAAGISNQLDRYQHGASIRVSNRWLNDALEGSFLAVGSFTRGDYLLRPRLTYAFNDQWKGSVGADVFRGSPETFFGRLRRTSGVFAELRYSF